ncbi:MAG: DUF4097 domain-containing protein [Oscillospiraceae bacterium]|jgi:hypothetical protein|nr:DUF4097 domain-containing protein [Oscillospiraceae bacterium]
MKTSAIIRIVLWSFVALLLTAVLCVSIAAPAWSFLPSFENMNWGINVGGSNLSYANSELYTPAMEMVTLDGVSSISVNWPSGGVLVQAHDKSTVSFSETGAENADEEMKLHYYVTNNRLFVQFAKAKRWYGWSFPGKQLTMFVPQSMLQELGVSSVSAKIELKDFSAMKLDVESVSGDISLLNLTANSCDVEQVSGRISGEGVNFADYDAQTVSGRAELSGSFQTLSHEGVSGSADYVSAVCPEEARISSVSGSMQLRIPENPGFTARYERVSGSFSSEFPAISEKNRSVYGDGSAEFSFETVSGSISIMKLPV